MYEEIAEVNNIILEYFEVSDCVKGFLVWFIPSSPPAIAALDMITTDYIWQSRYAALRKEIHVLPIGGLLLHFFN